MATATSPAPAGAGEGEIPARSIVIPKGCKPSKACGTDRTRPILTHAYLRQHDRQWWLCMTDGYIAVALKVTAGVDVVEGYVPVGALRMMEAGKHAEQQSGTAWRVVTNDGLLTFDCGYLDGRPPGEFPDFKGLGVWDKPDSGDVNAIGMNTELMWKIGQALGTARQNVGCRMDFVSPLRPIWVTPLMAEPTGVALQMPIRLNT